MKKKNSNYYQIDYDYKKNIISRGYLKKYKDWKDYL